MTKLYHYTSFFAKEVIEEEGLRVDYKNDDTLTVNETIDEHRPNNLPPFIDRSRCIFFYMKEMPSHDNDYNIAAVVDTKNIDTNKLYVFDFDIADRIWGDIIDAPYSEEYSGICLSQSAKDYWASMIPYEEYIKRSEKEKYKKEELLYFENIPKEFVEIRSDRSPFFTQLVERLQEKFDIKVTSKHGLSIFIGEQQIYCNYRQKTNELKLIVFSIIRYKINEDVIKAVEDFISYDKVEKSDRLHKILFSNVKLKE